MSGNLFGDVDETEDIFGTERSKDPFSEIDTKTQMNLFSPGKKESLFDFDANGDEDSGAKRDEDKDLFGAKRDEDKDLFGAEQDDNEDLFAKRDEDKDLFSDDTRHVNGGSLENPVDDDFELIESSEAPTAEEAERELERIRLEAEKRKKEEDEERERQRKEKHEPTSETTDGGFLSKASASRTKGNESEPLAVSPSLSDTEEPTFPQDEGETSQKEIAELTMKLRQAQSENAAFKEQVSQLTEQLKEEREKNSKLTAIIKEKDNEIASLKESSKPSPAATATGRKVSASRPPPSASVSSPKTSAKLNERKGNPSVADTVKKFSVPSDSKKPTSVVTKPSPPSRPRVAVNSKPEKPEKPALQRDSSASKLQSTGSARASSSKKERTTSVSSQEGTQSVAAAKREAAEKAFAAREQAVHEKVKAQETAAKSSPPKPQRNRTSQSNQATAEPESSPKSSPKMSRGGESRSALDAIKMWEQKSSSTTPENVSPKRSLTGQLSTPIIPSASDDSKEDSIEPPSTEEESAENKPPSTESLDEEKPDAKKAPLREKPVDKDVRGISTMSCIVRGSPAQKRWGPVLEKCEVCKKTVYQLERLQADGKVFHKSCFRCTHCKKVVGLGTYAANKGEIYCKVHFKMLFKMKGNYDEGFGRSQHKSKWSSKTDTDPETLVALTQ